MRNSLCPQHVASTQKAEENNNGYNKELLPRRNIEVKIGTCCAVQTHQQAVHTGSNKASSGSMLNHCRRTRRHIQGYPAASASSDLRSWARFGLQIEPASKCAVPGLHLRAVAHIVGQAPERQRNTLAPYQLGGKRLFKTRTFIRMLMLPVLWKQSQAHLEVFCLNS